MKQGGERTKNLYWHIFVKTLQMTELEKSLSIGKEWGEKVTAAMNAHFCQLQGKDPQKKDWVLDRFVFTGVEAVVEKASDNIVVMDMVLLAKLLFKEEIKNGELFKDVELTELLFPGIQTPELLFMDKM